MRVLLAVVAMAALTGGCDRPNAIPEEAKADLQRLSQVVGKSLGNATAIQAYPQARATCGELGPRPFVVLRGTPYVAGNELATVKIRGCCRMIGIDHQMREMGEVLSPGLLASGCDLAAQPTTSATQLSAYSSTPPPLSEIYPGPWRTEPRLDLMEALTRNKVRGCGEWKHREAAKAKGRLVVACSRDGQTWTHYFVELDSAIPEVTGPYNLDAQF